MSDDQWREQGVEFRIIDQDLIPAAHDFLTNNFFPDEPISRSLGITGDMYLVSGYYKEVLRNGSSIAAVDRDGNILGVRAGAVASRSWFLENFLGFLCWASFMLPARASVMFKLIQLLEFNTHAMFAKLKCEWIYEDAAVCSGRFHGIKGLGTELVRRSEKLAKEKGCSHTYALVTGKYSAKIFDREGHTLLKAVVYDQFRDSSGELYLKDTREHVQCGVYVKEL